MGQSVFLFHIASTSGMPIYRQLMDQVMAMVGSGRLRPGDFLPSIREVGKVLEINPMTVSKVYSILERDGVLENVRGQGMKVIGLPETRATLKERRAMIMPAVKQLVQVSRQAGLEQKDVVEMLDILWKE